MTTIGEWIDQQVADYQEVYEGLTENPIPGASARAIIEGEIKLRLHQWQMVDQKMWEFFEEQER